MTPQNNRKVSGGFEQFCGEDAQQGRASGAARARVHSSAECGGASSAPLKRRASLPTFGRTGAQHRGPHTLLGFERASQRTAC